MTTINTSSLNSNPSPFTFVVKKPEADAVKASTTSATDAEKATDESTTYRPRSRPVQRLVAAVLADPARLHSMKPSRR